jgi:hypothetical protein
MSDTTSGAGSTTTAPATRAETEPTLWTGWIMFGSIMMMMLGSFHAIEGIVALARSEYFLVTRNGLTITVDYTTWGWAHLILGIIVAGTGFAILFGQLWAMILGVVIAGISALVNLAFLAAYPVWSLMMIALDVIVIWALTVHGAEIRSARQRART